MTVDQLALFSIIRKESSEMLYDVISSHLKRGEKKALNQNKEDVLEKLGLIYEYSMDGKTQLRQSFINFHGIFTASDYISSLIDNSDALRIDRIIISSNFQSVELEDDDIKLLRLIYVDYDGLDIPNESMLDKEIKEKLGLKSLDDSLKRISGLGILGFYEGKKNG